MSLSHVVESLVLHNSNGGNVGYLPTGCVYCTGARTRSICLFQYGNPNSNPNPKFLTLVPVSSTGQLVPETGQHVMVFADTCSQ